jgi:hypothetical protein
MAKYIKGSKPIQGIKKPRLNPGTGQHDLAARASLAQHAGTLGCRHCQWCPMNIEIP